jgi:hypothetical protein
MTLIEELKKRRFDGCDIHSFEGEVVAMSDIEKVVDGLVHQLQEMKYGKDAEGKYFEGFDRAIDLVLKKLLGAKTQKESVE